MPIIRFWNGNKSAIRQSFELALLSKVLEVSVGEFCDARVVESTTDYPRAEDEGAIFKQNIDLCITVAGNPKFKKGQFIPIYHPLMKGLLGHRLLIIREQDSSDFARIKSAPQLRQKLMGIPATWADAQLFRDNDYRVDERGSLETVFQRLKNKECDYMALGANEVQTIFDDFAGKACGLVLEQSLRLYYPFALVFYIDPSQAKLAKSLEQGVQKFINSGAYRTMFCDFFLTPLTRLNLVRRNEIELINRQLPKNVEQDMRHAKLDLLSILGT